MKKVSLIISATLVALIVVSSCGGEASNEASTSKETAGNDEEESTAQDEINKNDEDLMIGDISLVIDGEEYKVTEFDKRRSEITWMDDNKVTLRLNSLDKERGVQILISGDDTYGKKPLDITLDATQYEKANHGSLTFTGFIGKSDNLSNTQLILGKATVKTMDTTSLEFEMSFVGEGLHTEMGGIRDTVPVSGNMIIKFDHSVDARSKK